MNVRVIILALPLLACGGTRMEEATVSRATPVAAAAERAAATITAGDLGARIGFLASDALRGRDTPSAGLEAAAAYIASEFATMRLQPAGDSGSYLQRYPFVTTPDDSQTPVEHRPPNVVAILQGTDPALRNTYVVFSAHMDHVGVGAPDARGDSIYNGADDDASGTATVVELAEAFAALALRPARSLIFLTVSGEEKGLLGSAWFADNPPVPAEQIVANINIDMIGRNWPDTVAAIGLGFSSLGPLALQTARQHPELGITVVDDAWPDERFFFRSDHFNFARKEIPAIFFFSGTHEDYHRPSDHADRIDTEKTARIARLLFHLGHAIATNPQPPEWSEEGLRQVRALTGSRN
jgi:hypothetical protein